MNKTQLFEAKQAEMSDSELIELAHREVCELASSYGKSHKMTIPPMVTDTDMLLGELIRRFKTKHQWINVLDELPKLGQKVLCVQDPTTTATKEALYAVYDGVGFQSMTPMIFANYEIGKTRWADIIKWMPLPDTI